MDKPLQVEESQHVASLMLVASASLCCCLVVHECYPPILVLLPVRDGYILLYLQSLHMCVCWWSTAFSSCLCGNYLLFVTHLFIPGPINFIWQTLSWNIMNPKRGFEDIETISSYDLCLTILGWYWRFRKKRVWLNDATMGWCHLSLNLGGPLIERWMQSKTNALILSDEFDVIGYHYCNEDRQISPIVYSTSTNANSSFLGVCIGLLWLYNTGYKQYISLINKIAYCNMNNEQ